MFLAEQVLLGVALTTLIRSRLLDSVVSLGRRPPRLRDWPLVSQRTLPLKPADAESMLSV